MPALVIVCVTALLIITRAEHLLHVHRPRGSTTVGGVPAADVGAACCSPTARAGAVGLRHRRACSATATRGDAVLLLLVGVVIAVLGLAVLAPGAPSRWSSGSCSGRRRSAASRRCSRRRMLHSVSARMRDTAVGLGHDLVQPRDRRRRAARRAPARPLGDPGAAAGRGALVLRRSCSSWPRIGAGSSRIPNCTGADTGLTDERLITVR